MSLTWKGRLRLDQLTPAMRRGAEAGLDLALEHVLGESRRLVPIEEATLERSGSTSQDGLRGAVSYDTPYAVRQHEDMTLRHDAGRTAKYLEGPLTGERDVVAALVAREIRKALGT